MPAQKVILEPIFPPGKEGRSLWVWEKVEGGRVQSHLALNGDGRCGGELQAWSNFLMDLLVLVSFARRSFREESWFGMFVL